MELLIRCVIVVLIMAGMIVSSPVSSLAQAQSEPEAVFLGVKKSDRVGPTGATPDGKPDAVFSLNIPAKPTDPRIAEIEIQAVSGSPGIWNTTGRAPAGFVGIARAKNPSEVMNPKGGALNLSPRDAANLLLFVTDDGTLTQSDRRFQVKVIHKGGTSLTIPARADLSGAAEDVSARGGAFPFRMTAVLKGISDYDAVGTAKAIRGDDKADGLIALSVEARDKEITAIEIKNTDGVASVWDTVPGNSNPPIGVALVSDPVRLLNNRDGSVAIKVGDRVDLNLYVADNGSIVGGKTSYRVSVKFSDGTLSWCPVQKASPPTPAEAPKPPAPPAGAKVSFLGTWMGYVSFDAVGEYAGLKPDGKQDTVFGLDVEVSPKNFITGIEISSAAGITKRWSTRSTDAGAWGLGVAYQNSPDKLLNRSDGSVSIPIDGRLQFYIYAADPGDMQAISTQLRIILHLADGSSYQQFVRKPPASTATVAPGTDEPPRAVGLVTCEFRGFIVDLVNASTRPGKDGYLDGTFIMKLKVDDKKLTKVEIKSGDGVVRWSSEPKAPAMFLGVAVYPKIYNLVNDKSGAMQLPVSGRKTLYLYAADNGMLSDPKSLLTVVATFSDKSTLTGEVIK